MSSTFRNISLRELRAFCIAAEHESFRAAAEQLFLTASAISHQIKNLEEQLNKKLFVRNSRSIRLTDAGRSFYEDIRPVIEQLDAAIDGHLSTERRARLRISVQPFFASELFIPRLAEFRSVHPDIDIEVDTSDESAEKHPVDADLSIRLFRSPPASLTADRLLPLTLVPAGSPEFRKKVALKKKQIVGDFPLIVHDTRPNAWSQWAKSSGITLPDDANIMRLDSMIAVARAAERGLGAALVPLQLSDLWFENGDLERLFDHELRTSDAYYVVCNKSDMSSGSVQVFRDWVLQAFGEPA